MIIILILLLYLSMWLENHLPRSIEVGVVIGIAFTDEQRGCWTQGIIIKVI